jgi:sirohydrochlorin cobaltochelatase
MSAGVLLFAHGARDPLWAAPFQAIAAQLRAQAPTLQVAGCQRVTVVPLFLGSGGHVRRDVPQRVAAVAQQHPQVQFHCTTAIGEAAGVIRAIAIETLALVQAAENPQAG